MNHLKVSSRLGWSFGTLTGLLALVAAISLVRLSGMNDAIDTVVNDRAPKVEALNDMAYRTDGQRTADAQHHLADRCAGHGGSQAKPMT